jgi:hypothetical protein
MSEPGESSGGAARCAVRLAMARNWVNRRVQAFSFLDADTVRCRMSIDLTLPAMSFVAAGDSVFVPLLALAKRDLRNLDVRGPDDRPLPVLTTEQNAKEVVRGIKEHLDPLLPTGIALGDNHEAELRQIVKARGKGGGARKSLQLDALLGLLLDQVSDQLVREEVEHLIQELESVFLLLVELEYQPDRRIVCKVSYDIARQQAAGATRADRRYARFLASLASLGLLARYEVLECDAFGLCESYHTEVIPPKDTYVVESSLTVCRQSGDTLERTPPDEHRFRSHLRAVPSARGDTATLTVVLHAYRQELLFPLAFSGLLISVVLALLPAHVYAIDAQTVAALLLVPFALSAYYVRGQDNSYVTRMLRGARLLVLLPLAAAIYVLTLVGIGELPPAKGSIPAGAFRGLQAAFLVSAFPASVLLVALVAPWLGRRVRARARAWRRTMWRVVGLALLVALAGLVCGGVLGSIAWLRAEAPSQPAAIISCSGVLRQTPVRESESPCHCRESRRHADADGRGRGRSNARKEPAECARPRRRRLHSCGARLGARSPLREPPRRCWRGRR